MNPVKLKEENVSYEEYCKEILQRERNEFVDPWKIGKSLTDKVDAQGGYKPFFGDTIVYTLPSEEQSFFHTIQQQLLSEFPGLFAQDLDYKQYHITIHDLANSPKRTDVVKRMIKNQNQCQKILKKLRRRSNCEIEIKSTHLFPSKKTAVIMGFLPASQDHYWQLLEVYNLFEKLCFLDYWPHLHVTLNYFRPEIPPEAQMQNLFSFCQQMSHTPIVLKLDLLRSVYQHFTDMNHYKDII